MVNLEWVRNVKAAEFTIEKHFSQYAVHDASGKRLAKFRRKYEAQAYISRRVGSAMRGVERAVAAAADEVAAEMSDANAERIASHRPPAWEARFPTELSGHVVYRAIAPDGEVLYVGVTNSLWTRMAGHRATSPWWAEATEIDWVVYSTRARAEAEEKRAIKRHRPRFNIIYGG